MGSKRCSLISITLLVVFALLLVCLVGWHFTPDGGSAAAWVQAFFASAAIVAVVFLQQWTNQRADTELEQQRKIHMAIAQHHADGVLDYVKALIPSCPSDGEQERWPDIFNVLDDMYAQGLSLDCNRFERAKDALAYLEMLKRLRKVRGYVRHIVQLGCPERGIDSLRHDCESTERAVEKFREVISAP